MADRGQRRKLPVSAGTVALMLAGVGGVLWRMSIAAHGAQTASWLLLKAYGLGELLIVAGGVLGGYATAARNEGRIQGLLALAVLALWLAWLFR